MNDFLREKSVDSQSELQVAGALRRLQLHGTVKQVANLLPALGRHVWAVLVISWCNQTRAVAQCRLTVAEEIFST